MTPLRIAVAEDEWLVAEELRVRLEALGHEVVGPVDTADELVALAARERPDLALVDIRLADGSDGLVAARVLQERFAIPVIAVTAHLTAEEAEAAGLLGALAKPVTPARLAAALAGAAARLRCGAGEEVARGTARPAPALRALQSAAAGPSALTRCRRPSAVKGLRPWWERVVAVACLVRSRMAREPVPLCQKRPPVSGA